MVDYLCALIRPQFSKMTQCKQHVKRGSILTSLLLALVCHPDRALSQTAHPASDVKSPQPTAARDGQHDFDFNIGTWTTHIKRIQDPLSGSTHSIELKGVVTVRKIWGGRARLEEIETDGPNGHWQGMSLFLYNPQSHQWSQAFINSKAGVLAAPLVGSFKDGRGELFSQDTVGGKSILVRGVWSDITPDSHRYEESYSNDGGKTWASAFIADLTRKPATASDTTSPQADAGATDAATGDRQHDFDFDLGTWKTHSSRLLHPLTGSTSWVELDGVSVVKQIWGGRANIAEYKADGPEAHVELLSLRWYNPETHQWNLDFATPNVGTLGIPGVGEFKNGRGDFYDYEPINGKFVLVRFSIWRLSPDTAQSEQAFSDDGGKTWEVNWINRYTRVRE